MAKFSVQKLKYIGIGIFNSPNNLTCSVDGWMFYREYPKTCAIYKSVF